MPAPKRPLQWLDLAEGRLRLDRLWRNSGVTTFFPCRLRRHSSRDKKAAPLLSGPCGVRRRSPPACRSPSRPQWCGLDNGNGDLKWRPSAPSRRPARTSSPAKSSPSASRPRACASSPTSAPPAKTPPATGFWSAASRSAPPGPSAPTRAATIWASSSTIRASRRRSCPGLRGSRRLRSRRET